MILSQSAEQDAAGNSRRVGELTIQKNSNIIITGHISLRRLWLS
jgi:hypothetical protein